MRKLEKRHTGTGAEAYHDCEGELHFVGLTSLKVLVLNDDGSWFAQALEIDYAAEGTSLADVKRRFEAGLEATVHAQLEKHGSIENLLKEQAPDEYWDMYVDAAKRTRLLYTQGTVHVLQAPTSYPTALDQPAGSAQSPSQTVRLEYLQPQ